MQWEEFLKRPMSLSTVYVHIRCYTQIVPGIVGCPLARVIYFYDGRDTHILHELQEMKRFGQTVKKRIHAEPEFLDLLINNAMEWQNKGREFVAMPPVLMDAPTLKLTLDFFIQYLANAVNIPHRLSWVFEQTADMDEATREKLKIVRSASYFAQIEKIILGIISGIVRDNSLDAALLDPAEVLKDSPWPAAAEIDRRELGWILKLIDGERQFISGPSARAEYAKLISVDKSITKVKGAVACLGKVTGRAAVVSDFFQLATFPEQAVLITNMTTPEYVPYLKKVIAIVTDEGGSTCHAAIIARELDIPCVIGTKIATKIFQDGDMVEVDANQGVVRKIS